MKLERTGFRLDKLGEFELKYEDCNYNNIFDGSLLWDQIFAITNYLNFVLYRNVCWLVYEIRDTWLSDFTNCDNLI